MSEIKLEVGKTYRNRNGEEVKIVRKNDNGRPPYLGSNGEWYTEGGKWQYFGAEFPEDLIEEVEEAPETRHTFAIPDGVKEITLDYFGNLIVVEMVPEDIAPKPGDVMVNSKGSVYIFKDVYGSYHKDYAWLGDDGRLVIGGHCFSGRPATPEEAQPLFDALKKAGKRWNPHTMVVEEKITEFTRILEWVETNTKDGYYNHEDIAEAIEAYLKHKEGGHGQ